MSSPFCMWHHPAKQRPGANHHAWWCESEVILLFMTFHGFRESLQEIHDLIRIGHTSDQMVDFSVAMSVGWLEANCKTLLDIKHRQKRDARKMGGSAGWGFGFFWDAFCRSHSGALDIVNWSKTAQISEVHFKKRNQEPKWPLFWLQGTLFWRGQGSK